jgi:hypothetical protein
MYIVPAFVLQNPLVPEFALSLYITVLAVILTGIATRHLVSKSIKQTQANKYLYRSAYEKRRRCETNI